MNRIIKIIFLFLAVVVDFGIGIFVRGFKPTSSSYKITDNNTEYNFAMGPIKNRKFQAIYFGTLWCGDGTKARENREIGYFDQTGNFNLTRSNASTLIQMIEIFQIIVVGNMTIVLMQLNQMKPNTT